MKLQGKVLWYNDNKGFGFIRPENGSPDVFTHYSAFEGTTTQYGILTEGETVEFEAVTGPKGPQASKVWKVKS